MVYIWTWLTLTSTWHKGGECVQPEGARMSSIKFSTTTDIKGDEGTADDQGLEERILGRQRNDIESNKAQI